jgi:hypothetical protein
MSTGSYPASSNASAWKFSSDCAQRPAVQLDVRPHVRRQNNHQHTLTWWYSCRSSVGLRRPTRGCGSPRSWRPRHALMRWGSGATHCVTVFASLMLPWKSSHCQPQQSVSTYCYRAMGGCGCSFQQLLLVVKSGVMTRQSTFKKSSAMQVYQSDLNLHQTQHNNTGKCHVCNT